MKRIAAGLCTFALMGWLLWAGATRPASAPDVLTGAQPDQGAAACLNALLDSTARGDVSAYLSSFGAPLRPRLEREVAERGRDGFASDLRRAAGARKSRAVFAPEPDGDNAARITVETVYPDRNERQTYRLERGPAGWLVTDVETIRGHQPPAKFGTPASYQEPEGVPVQGVTTED